MPFFTLPFSSNIYFLMIFYRFSCCPFSCWRETSVGNNNWRLNLRKSSLPMNFGGSCKRWPARPSYLLLLSRSDLLWSLARIYSYFCPASQKTRSQWISFMNVKSSEDSLDGCFRDVCLLLIPWPPNTDRAWCNNLPIGYKTGSY